MSRQWVEDSMRSETILGGYVFILNRLMENKMKNSLRMIGIAGVTWFGLSGGVANALSPGPITFNDNGTSYDGVFGNNSVLGAFNDSHEFKADYPMFGPTGASVISGFSFDNVFNVTISSFNLYDVTSGSSSLVATGSIFGGIVGSLSSSQLTEGNDYSLVLIGDLAGGAESGSYAGNISIAPIPEPETYAMLLVGLGLVGFTLRRRKAESTLASLA
jgi:hypothetical protein